MIGSDIHIVKPHQAGGSTSMTKPHRRRKIPVLTPLAFLSQRRIPFHILVSYRRHCLFCLRLACKKNLLKIAQPTLLTSRNPCRPFCPQLPLQSQLFLRWPPLILRLLRLLVLQSPLASSLQLHQYTAHPPVSMVFRN